MDAIFKIKTQQPIKDCETYDKIYQAFEKEDRQTEETLPIPITLLELVKENINFNVVNDENETILFEVAYGNQPELVHFFLDHGVNINHINDDGINPVLAAVLNRSYEAFQALLDRGAIITLEVSLKINDIFCKNEDKKGLKILLNSSLQRRSLIMKYKQN